MSNYQELEAVLAECIAIAAPVNRFFLNGATLIEEYENELIGYGKHQRVIVENATVAFIEAHFGVTYIPEHDEPVAAAEPAHDITLWGGISEGDAN